MDKKETDEVRREVSVSRQIDCLHALMHHLYGVIPMAAHPRCEGEVPKDIQKPGRLSEAGKAAMSFVGLRYGITVRLPVHHSHGTLSCSDDAAFVAVLHELLWLS